MGSSESKPLPDTVRFLVVPVVVGVLTMIVMTYFEWVKERHKKYKDMLEEQMTNAMEVGQKTITMLDELSAIMMKHTPNSAWDVAWRRARFAEQKDHFQTPQDKHLMEEVDKETWKMFLEKWKECQCQEMSLETQLKASFGPTGPECILFKEITERINFAATMLWNIYYVKKSKQLQKERSFSLNSNHDQRRLPEAYFHKSKTTVGPSSMSYRLLHVEDDVEIQPKIMNENSVNSTTSKDDIAVVGWTREDQIQNGTEMFELFRDIRDKIQMLSESITICIQQHDVGTLRFQTKQQQMQDDYIQHDMNRMFTTTSTATTTTTIKEEENDDYYGNGANGGGNRSNNNKTQHIRRLLTFKETPFLVQPYNKSNPKKTV